MASQIVLNNNDFKMDAGTNLSQIEVTSSKSIQFNQILSAPNFKTEGGTTLQNCIDKQVGFDNSVGSIKTYVDNATSNSSNKSHAFASMYDNSTEIDMGNNGNHDLEGTFTLEEQYEFTQTNSECKFTYNGSTAKTFLVTFHFSHLSDVKTSDSSDDYLVKCRVDSVDKIKMSFETNSSGTYPRNASLSGIVQLQTNEVVDVVIEPIDNSQDIVISYVNLVITEL
jgi:hypothetical protein